MSLAHPLEHQKWFVTLRFRYPFVRNKSKSKKLFLFFFLFIIFSLLFILLLNQHCQRVLRNIYSAARNQCYHSALLQHRFRNKDTTRNDVKSHITRKMLKKSFGAALTHTNLNFFDPTSDFVKGISNCSGLSCSNTSKPPSHLRAIFTHLHACL